jgi:hypothetical protein
VRTIKSDAARETNGLVGLVHICNPSTEFAALRESAGWHTFSVRCAAVIPSGYRVTFVVLVTRLAGELLTHNESCPAAPVICVGDQHSRMATLCRGVCAPDKQLAKRLDFLGDEITERSHTGCLPHVAVKN